MEKRNVPTTIAGKAVFRDDGRIDFYSFIRGRIRKKAIVPVSRLNSEKPNSSPRTGTLVIGK